MRLLAAFAAHELRTQWRSLRFRVLAALYVAAGSTPGDVDLAAAGADADWRSAPPPTPRRRWRSCPLLTAVVAFLISLDAITREQDEGAWSTVALVGMSNAGYLLRRWLALQALLLPLTAPAPLAAAAAVAVAVNGPARSPPAPFVGPWLLHVVPIALVVLGRRPWRWGRSPAARSTPSCSPASCCRFLPVLVNALLGRFGIRLGGPLDWLDLPRLIRSINRMASRGRREQLGAPVPVRGEREPLRPRAVAGRAPGPGGGAGGPGRRPARASPCCYLRRTRPDVRPWRIRPDHPLRTFLGALARLRERYTPDPVAVRADLLSLGAALLARPPSARPW